MVAATNLYILPTARGAADICRGEGADIKHIFLTNIY